MDSISIILSRLFISWVKVIGLVLMRLSLVLLVWDLLNVEKTAPVIGNSGGFPPSVDGVAPFVFGMTNNAIEEVFRMFETFSSLPVDF